MKKILFAAVAVAAICFTSCGNKTQQADAEAVDSVAVIDSLSEEAAHASIDALSSVITAKDADKLKDVLENCKAKAVEFVKQNPELAKSYLTKVQNFLKENKDKISEFVSKSPAAQDAFNALISIDAENGLSNFISAIEEKAVEVKDDAEAAAKDAVQEQVDNAKAAAQEKADEAKAEAKEKANQAIDDAAAKAKKSLGF